MVPNFLNLPFFLFGIGAPGDVVGLGMYVTSRVAECPYCSAHACSFALRRGASPEQMAEALLGASSRFNRGELATIAVACSLGRIPCEISQEERDELIAAFAPDRAEWIVLGMVMMGFLNKFMNAIGVELEGTVVDEVCATIGPGWSPGKAGFDLDPGSDPKPLLVADGLWTKLRLVPMLPRALLQDKRWQAGAPTAWPAVGHYLHERTDYGFPILSKLRHGRAIQSIATMLRENLDPATSQIGLRAKVLAGLIFAEVVRDPALARDIRALGPQNGVTKAEMDEAVRFASGTDADWSGPDGGLRSALVLARAALFSPVEIEAGTVAHVRKGGLTPAAIVELICWLSVLQMLHRLTWLYGKGRRRGV
jgi:alkylhydroperoxidase family enzyme